MKKYLQNIALKSIIILYLTVLLFFIPYSNSAQEIRWSDISYGVSSQFMISNGDMEKYWGKNLGAGPILKYYLIDGFSLEGAFLISFWSPKELLNGAELPDIILLSMPAGIKYSLPVRQRFKFSTSAGIENNTFLFDGGIASDKRNTSESEFGLFLSASVEFLFDGFGRELGIEFFAKVLNLFSLPEQIRFHSLGINLLVY